MNLIYQILRLFEGMKCFSTTSKKVISLFLRYQNTRINLTKLTRLQIPAPTSFRTDFAESNSSQGRIELKLLLLGFCWKFSRAVHVSLENLKQNEMFLSNQYSPTSCLDCFLLLHLWSHTKCSLRIYYYFRKGKEMDILC